MQAIAKIMRVSPAPYGRYDTEVFAWITREDGEEWSSETALASVDLPFKLEAGMTITCTTYRHLIETVLEEIPDVG